jgi:uncharacterized membrane protein
MRRSGGWPAVLVGVGAAAQLDEILFHQLLHWHHLYDRSQLGAGLVSDGLLVLLATIAMVVGLVVLVEREGAMDSWGRRTWGLLLAGVGGFNLFDGVVDHKLLRLHQIRGGVPDLLPYDAGWIAGSLVLLAVGIAVARRSVRQTGTWREEGR